MGVSHLWMTTACKSFPTGGGMDFPPNRHRSPPTQALIPGSRRQKRMKSGIAISPRTSRPASSSIHVIGGGGSLGSMGSIGQHGAPRSDESR